MELDNRELFSDFILVASSLHKNGYGSKFGEVQDKAKIGSSYLISCVAQYMIKHMRIQETMEFLHPFAEEDPLLLGLICDAIL
jgi:tetratricopeptide (TPR) repeat protein